jgi:hypothetical protein
LRGIETDCGRSSYILSKASGLTTILRPTLDP